MKFPEFYDEVITMLGGTLVDVEFEPKDVYTFFKRAKRTFKQKGNNHYRLKYVKINVEKGKTEYDLPESPKIHTIVKAILPRTLGMNPNNAYDVGLFDNLYGSYNSGFVDTVNMEIIFERMEQLQRFIPEIDFDFDEFQNKIRITRNDARVGTCILETYVDLENEEYMDIQWIIDWTTAEAKEALGLAYRKFGSLPGPTGQTNLSGDQLVNEAKEQKQQLLEDALNFVDGEMNWGGISIG